MYTVPTVFLIDRIGRRPLFFGGAASMATCLIIVGCLTAAFGHSVSGAGASTTVTWVVEGHPAVRNAIIGKRALYQSSLPRANILPVVQYFLVCGTRIAALLGFYSPSPLRRPFRLLFRFDVGVSSVQISCRRF